MAQAQATARFTVTTDPVATAGGPLQGFTATIGALSEGQGPISPVGGVMEPAQLRTWFSVQGGTARSLTAARSDITFSGRFASRIFDGAQVDILRLQNGRFTRLRSARIAAGGHQPNAWSFLHWPRRLLAPDTTTAQIQIPKGWRDGVPVHIGLIAVDRDGRLSDMSISNPVTTTPTDARPRPAQAPNYFNTRSFHGLEGERSRRLSAPKGLRAEIRGGVLHLSWDQPGWTQGRNLSGYSLLFSFDGAAPLSPSRLVFETDGPAPQRGDLAILRVEVSEFSRDLTQSPAWWHDLRGANPMEHSSLMAMLRTDSADLHAGLMPHDADTVVPTPGTHFLRAEVWPAQPFEMQHFSLGPTKSTFRHPLKPGQEMEISFWARAPDGDDVAVRTVIADFAATVNSVTGKPLRGGHAEPLTPEWQRYSLRFHTTAADVGRPVRFWFRLEGRGIVDIDNIFISEAGDAPGHATTRVVDALSASPPSFLRTHHTIKTGMRTYSLKQIAGVPAGTHGQGLHPVLSLMETAGTRPWLQIEPHLSAEEWLGLVEYLAAPWDPNRDSAATKPYAALRVAQGRKAPWTDSFDALILELGNETWNGLFRPWVGVPLQDAGTGNGVGAGTMLGAYQAYVMDVMERSPHWPQLAPKLETVLGGWARRVEFGVEAAMAAARAGQPLDHMGVAVYVGGWDEGESVVTETPAGFTSMLSNSVQVAVPRVRTHLDGLNRLARAGLPVPNLVMYEGGPGYSLNGLNRQRVTEEQAERQERVLKSKASGTATLDAFLASAQAGMRLQNFFNFRHGTTWSSHAPSGFGGHPYPTWEWASQLGHDIRGSFLTVQAETVPRTTFPGLEQREGMRNAPLVDVYALRDEARLTIVAVSRAIPGALNVAGDGTVDLRVDLPLRSIGAATRLHMPGPFDAHDVSEDMARLVKDAVPAPLNPTALDLRLEPGAAVAYIFDNVEWK